MSNRWYYRSSREEIGPISFAGLRRMALEQVLSPETMVREDRDGQWKRAGDIESLYTPTRDPV
ncbi:MAG: DUF4339 domain-containing protein [Thermoguttaceae bacterium]